MTKIDRKSIKKRESNSLYEKPARQNSLYTGKSADHIAENELQEPEIIRITRTDSGANNAEKEDSFKEKLIRQAPAETKQPAPKAPVNKQPAPKAQVNKQPAPKAQVNKQPAPKAPASKQPTPPAPVNKQPNLDIPLRRQPVREAPAYRQPPVKKKSKKPLIAVIVIVLCLIGAYVAGIFIWEDKFLPNTFINGQSVSNMTAAEAEELLLPQNTEFRITELDGEESIPLSSFDYRLTFNKAISDVITEQNRYAWPLAFLSKNEQDNAVTISYDRDLLEEQVDALDAFNEDMITDPKDACLEKGPAGHYELVPEVMGNRLDHDRVMALIDETVKNGSYEVDLNEGDYYLKPSVYSDNKELKEDLDFVKKIGEETITIDLTGAEEVLEPMDLKEFVEFDEYDNISVNDEVLTDYVYELSQKYDTYLNERKFTDHTGNVRTVGGNHTMEYGIDTYGFLMNREATAEILRECILSMEDSTMTPSWDVPAITRNDVNDDIGDTYIEISLLEQHLWYFVDGNLIFDADVVTGLDTDERRTPWGLFRAYEKDQDCVLKGEMAGERWNTRVGYWISVTWTAVGIHDATWQPMFGGDWYKTGGSHGCINVSYETAQFLYENLAIDTPIVIY